MNQTTREQRAKYLRDALALSTLDCPPPTTEDMEIFEKYVDGKIKISEILQILDKKYNLKEHANEGT